MVKIVISLLLMALPGLAIADSQIEGFSDLAGLNAVPFQPARATLPEPQQRPPSQQGFQQSGPGSSGGYLSGPSSADPLDIALDYLRQNKDALGLTNDDLADMVVKDRYVSKHNQVTHIYLHQRLDGIEVFNGVININVSRDGRVINLGNRFVSDLKNSVNIKTPSLSAIDAANQAAQHLDLVVTKPLVPRRTIGGAEQAVVLSDGGISQDDIPVKLMYQPGEKGEVRLVWDLVLRLNNNLNWWDLRVDAETGRILSQNDWIANDTYRVYAIPLEHPNDGSRSLVSNPAHATASPFGWHDDNGAAGAEYTITRGNNVHAYADTDANNAPDFGSEPDGGAGLNFDLPLDLTQSPDTYLKASITNLFYWNNVIHDVFYLKGFDEAAGNFQENNYGNGGSAGDYVRAEAQDGTSFNNANFATPPDGFRPRMQMFLWNLTSPNRDGDLDNGIIIHEYGHGISTRLTGGPSVVSCLNNNEQMGEGWSDFFGLVLTADPGDTATTSRGIGTYVLGQSPTGPGIRPAPYTTDMAVNSYTYGDVGSLAIPHGVGFLWSTMLWEVYWNLVNAYGFNPNIYDTANGNNLALQIVVDGLKLQPCSPGFVDGRDAILAADLTLTGGANKCAIWDGFAKRGLGFSASQGSSSSTSDGTEAFDLPPDCTNPDFTLQVTPTIADVCKPADATYNVNVGQLVGFSDPVTLSASGQPAGTTVNFSVNPVTPPGAGVLTIGNTGAAAAGGYQVDVVGQASSKVHTATVTLNLFDGAPGGVTLSLPPNGAVNQPLAPNYVWTSATQGLSYTLQVATDAAFTSIVYSTTVAATNHTPGSNLSPATEYYWRVQPANKCGLGAFSSPFTFTTRATPAVLLVDDDDNNPDVRSAYTGTLDSLGVAYDIYDTNNSDNEPDTTKLSAYSTVIWFSGDAYAFGNGPAGPGSAGEAALASFLDSGKCLFISSQDYHWDKGLTSFMSNYLGVATVTDDVKHATVTGVGSVFSGLGPYTLAYPFSNFSDLVSPDATAELAFDGNLGNAAVNKDNGYRTTFWGFPFESLPTSTDRQSAMNTFLNWCSNAGAAVVIDPTSLVSAQLPDTTTIQTLTISNTGDIGLKWEIGENESLIDQSFASARQVMLSLDQKASKSGVDTDLSALQLIVDDGASENQIGDGGQFVWFNRFTPNPADFPILLEEVWVQFGSSNVSVGDAVDLVIYEDIDGDGNPGTNATHLATYNTTVKIAGGGVWSVYPLSPTVVFNDPGDVLIGVVNRYSSEGFSDFPAEIDQTGSQERSWAASYLAGNVPNPPTYPADEQWGTIDSFGFPGNWMIRGFGKRGSCGVLSDLAWVDVSPISGTVSTMSDNPVTVTFDSNGMSPGTYAGNLCISTSDSTTPFVVVPLTMTVTSTSSNEIYLPIILKSGGTGSGIINGDFGSGPTGWTLYSPGGWPLITQSFPGTVTPHSGSWAVWLGGDYGLPYISYIQQQVTVPSGSPYLYYWHWIASADICGYDFGGVIINGSTVVDVYTLCTSTNTGGWVKHVVNLGAYAGQSVSLQIRAETDSSYNSNLFIDDMGFQANATILETSGPNGPNSFDVENTKPRLGTSALPDVVEELGPKPLLRPENWTPRDK